MYLEDFFKKSVAIIVKVFLFRTFDALKRLKNTVTKYDSGHISRVALQMCR